MTSLVKWCFSCGYQRINTAIILASAPISVFPLILNVASTPLPKDSVNSESGVSSIIPGVWTEKNCTLL